MQREVLVAVGFGHAAIHDRTAGSMFVRIPILWG
jgi:hypothetical protein